jgi:membrane protease YdiL (CAAX protease family)
VEPVATDTPGATPSSRRWGLAAACAAAIVVLYTGFQVVRQPGSPGLLLAAQAAGTAALLCLLAVGGAALGTQPVALRLGLRRGSARPAVVLLLAVGLLGLSLALDQAIDLFDLRSGSQLTQYDAAVAAEPWSAWPWMLLGLGVAPGIGEELFFRGLLQRGLHRWMGRAGAVVVAAAIFGAFHGELVHATGAFFLGVYLGTAAELTGGTRAPIACHVANNLAAVAGVALPERGLAPPLALVAAGISVAALALYLANRQLSRTSA